MQNICTYKKEVTEQRVKERDAAKVARLTKESSERAQLASSSLQSPAETHLVCWWCVHPLPQLPCIHLPINYDQKLDLFTTKGNFCSWQCAKAYALDMNNARSGEIQMYLALMRRRAVGKYTPLWPAPSRTFLKIFGGPMTIEEFRKFGGDVEPPILRWPNERFIQPLSSSEKDAENQVGILAPSSAPCKSKLKAIENSTVSQDTLKLKRNKPLERTKSKLENVLGITRKVA